MVANFPMEKQWTVFFFGMKLINKNQNYLHKSAQFNLVIIQIIEKNSPPKKGKKKWGEGGFITPTTLLIQPIVNYVFTSIGPCIENVTKSRNVKNWVWKTKLEVS